MIISVLNLSKLAVKVGVVLPAALSSLWLFKPGMHSPFPSTRVTASQTSSSGLSGSAIAEASGAESIMSAPWSNDQSAMVFVKGSDEATEQNHEMIYARRVRVENILGDLNRINEVSMQMDPDRAATLEPVLMDIAEEVMSLSDQTTIVKSSTDQDLGRIEATVKKLNHAVARSIEPEMSL